MEKLNKMYIGIMHIGEDYAKIEYLGEEYDMPKIIAHMLYDLREGKDLFLGEYVEKELKKGVI